MIYHGYELVGEWKNSQCGQTVSATKGGKRYFLKKYQTPVAPLDNGTLDSKTYKHNKELFESFVSTRKKINSTIRTITGPGGNIVIPCDEFIEGNNYVEVAEYIEGVVDEEEIGGVLAGLSVDVKKLLMQTAAGALVSVHGKNIIHSDLKIKNVLLVRNASTGNYVAKLIDFDSSYFGDDKPEEIVGTIDYYSPELGVYADSEDEREELEKKITEKSDIFSLGLIFHIYLCGSFPSPKSLTEKLRKRQEKGKVIYSWIVLNSGCELQISPLIKNANYISLISDMLSIDPNDRPTAREVLKRLQEADPVIEEPWPEHGVILLKGKLTSDNVVGLKKQSTSGDKYYELLFSNGKRKTYSREELLYDEYAKIMAPDGFCKPWDEHQIKFDLDRIKSRGFISGEQAVLSDIKGYKFYRSDSTATFFKLESLIAMKYAVKLVTSSVTVKGFDSPWPEHKVEFDISAIKSRGYVGCSKKTMGDVKGYMFDKADGTQQFIRIEMVLVQKMAKKL